MLTPCIFYISHISIIFFLLHFADVQKLILESWYRDDKCFEETKASNCDYNEIQKRQFLTVVGNSGSGKSATARHCALKLKALGYNVVPITKVKDILTSSFNPALKQLYLCDDPVGTEGLDTIKLSKAESCNDQIMRLLKSSNKKVLLTCRTQIVQDPVFQTSSSFIKTHVIDLHNTALQLSEVEMSAILSKHAKNEHLEPSETRNIPLTEIKCLNFPLLCKLYAGNKQYREKGKHFFLKPFPVIVDEIAKLKHRDKLKYYALALCLLHDNQLESRVFHIFSPATADETMIRQLMEACGLPRTTPLKDVETAVQSLIGVYLIKIKEVYSFIHDTLFEATAYCFGKDYPLEMLKHCSSSFIREYVRLGSSSDDNLIVLNTQYYHELCQRFIKDIEDGHFHDVFMSQLIDHNAFQRHFSEHLNSLANEKLIQLFFYTNVNLDKHSSYQTDNNVNIGSINLIKDLILSQPHVKCIHFLLALGLSSLAKVCLNKFDFSLKQTDALCLLPVACLGGNVEVVNILENDILKCSFNDAWFGNMSTLHMAALSGNASMMKLVIEQGVLVNRVSQDMSILLEGDVTVDLCDANGKSPLFLAAQYGHTDIIQVILQSGGKADLCDKTGASPLFEAALGGHTESVRLLLKNKAKIDLCDNFGTTPLSAAAENGQIDVVQQLLQCQANVDICRDDGVSPLYIASYYGHLEIVRLLLKHSSNVDVCENHGESPLYVATLNGHTDIVKLLLYSNANINLCNKVGICPLYLAAFDGNKDIVTLFCQYQPTACIDLKNEYGKTPLYVAARNGHTDIVGLLLQSKATVDLCDKTGVSPLYAAAQMKHESAVELLLRYNADTNLCRKNGLFPLYEAAKMDISK